MVAALPVTGCNLYLLPLHAMKLQTVTRHFLDSLSRISGPKALMLCLVPLAFLCLCIALFGVDLLFWDEWVIWGKLVRALDHGQFQLSSLWAQQNEQRNFAARAVGLLLMPWYKLDRVPEFYCIILLTCVSFAALALQFARAKRRFGVTGGNWLFPFGALLLFSTLQWQVFTVGVNTSIALTVACVLLGILVAAPRRMTPWRFAALGAIGLLGSFNFVNGLFYWILLLPFFVWDQSVKKHRMLWTGLFALLGLAAWGAYFYGYTKPQHHPALGFVLAHPLEALGFFLTYLGAPFCSDQIPYPLPLAIGAAGLLLGLLELGWFGLKRPTRLLELLPWLAILAFALMSDAATTVGRAGMGIQSHALQSRYIAFSNLFWIGLLAVHLAYKAERGRALPLLSPKREQYALVVLIGVFTVSTIMSVLVLFHRSQRFQETRDELFRLRNDSLLATNFPDTAYLKKLIPLYFSGRLSVYRDIGRFADYQPVELPGGQLLSAEALPLDAASRRPAGVLLRGRARDPETGRPPEAVLLVNDNTVIFAAKPGLPPLAADPAPAEHPAKQSAEQLAEHPEEYWSVFLPADYFPDPNAPLKAYALLADGKRIAPLAGSPAEARPPAPAYPEFIYNQFFYSE